MKINTAILLVGGRGSRLYPLTKTAPKPLIPFLNKPIMEYQVESLVSAGIKRIILALNYFSEQIKSKASEWEKKYNIEVIYSKEDEPLGTAGPIRLAEEFITGEGFLVLNADIYAVVDFKGMIKKFQECNSTNIQQNRTSALIMTTSVDDPTKYGLIERNGDLVHAFIEKPKIVLDNMNCINAGIYVLHKNVISHIGKGEVSIEKEVFPLIVSMGEMRVYQHEGIWCDIGVPKEYLNGQKKVLSGSSDENVSLGHNLKIGKGVTLENCAIFDDCVIGENCVIKNAIIGKGCTVADGVVINKKETSVFGDNTEITENLVE